MVADTGGGLKSLIAAGLLVGGLMSPAGAEEAVVSNKAEASARGLLRAATRVELGTQLNAQIAQMPLREGQRFKEGDLLVAFDCARYEAEQAAAKAGANAAWIDYKSKKRLLAHAAIGKDEVNLAGAKANQASAEVKVHEAINADCKIVAPFGGMIVEIGARQHEYPAADRPLLVILDDSVIEVEMVVPSNWLNWLEAGVPFRFEIEETGQSVPGQIARIGAEIDPVSQTVKIFGVMENNPDAIVLPGMSGTAIFAGRLDG